MGQNAQTGSPAPKFPTGAECRHRSLLWCAVHPQRRSRSKRSCDLTRSSGMKASSGSWSSGRFAGSAGQ